jgi:hypothetical protein
MKTPRPPHTETKEKIRPPKAVNTEHVHGATIPSLERPTVLEITLKDLETKWYTL